MTQKTFSVAGVSTFKGVTKVRFANDYVGRFKILAKNDHQDIELIELGGEFTKEEICQILMQHEKFQSEAAQSAISEFVVRNVKTVKQPKVAKTAKPEGNKTQLEQDIQAACDAAKEKINLDEIEEALF
jgi:vacuolar-type H+-ATPase subunit C/Vma6